MRGLKGTYMCPYMSSEATRLPGMLGERVLKETICLNLPSNSSQSNIEENDEKEKNDNKDDIFKIENNFYICQI